MKEKSVKVNRGQDCQSSQLLCFVGFNLHSIPLQQQKAIQHNNSDRWGSQTRKRTMTYSTLTSQNIYSQHKIKNLNII